MREIALEWDCELTYQTREWRYWRTVKSPSPQPSPSGRGLG